mgnify:CR=1 FL=1
MILNCRQSLHDIFVAIYLFYFHSEQYIPDTITGILFISASLEENIQLSCIHIHNICTFIPVICTSETNKNKKMRKEKIFSPNQNGKNAETDRHK